MERFKTEFGVIKIQQTAQGIEIALASADEHPGSVSVIVKNESNGDAAKLIWVK